MFFTKIHYGNIYTYIYIFDIIMQTIRMGQVKNTQRDSAQPNTAEIHTRMMYCALVIFLAEAGGENMAHREWVKKNTNTIFLFKLQFPFKVNIRCTKGNV